MTEGVPQQRDAEPKEPIRVGTQAVIIPPKPPKSPPRPAPREKQPSGERWAMAKTKAETVEKIVIVLLLLGGVAYGLPLIQAERTKADRDEAVAKAEIATREAAEKKTLDLDLSVQLLSPIERDRYVVISLELKNTGNSELTIPGEKLEATIRNVKDVDGSGRIVTGDNQTVLFSDGSDTGIGALKLGPGERRRLQSVQKFRNEGLHEVTAKITPNDREAFRASLFTHLN